MTLPPSSVNRGALPSSPATSSRSLSRPFPVAENVFLEKLRALGRHLRDTIVEQRQIRSIEELASVADLRSHSDIIYQMDRICERALLEFIEEEIAPEHPCILLAEGLSEGQGMWIGRKTSGSEESAIRLIVDPIDGTRGLMADKRSAWVLCAAAADAGPTTSLSDLVVAVQTEIPTTKQWRADQVWAIRGRGAKGCWEDIRSTQSGPLHLHPSQARDLLHGFASFARFFPGVRDVLAEIEEELIRRLVPPIGQDGRALLFEDQYISTGGQLYELMMGHDRFIADIRPLMVPILKDRGLPSPLCCHPYDLATVLIAQEAGVIVTAPDGQPLNYPLDAVTPCSWIGYANPHLRNDIQPILAQALRERNLLTSP